MVVVVSIVLAAVFLIFIDPILTLFGATDAAGVCPGIRHHHRPGPALYDDPRAVNSMIRADGSPKYAMLSMALGAVVNTILDRCSSLCSTWGCRRRHRHGHRARSLPS